jgi:hypothetical protein
VAGSAGDGRQAHELGAVDRRSVEHPRAAAALERTGAHEMLTAALLRALAREDHERPPVPQRERHRGVVGAATTRSAPATARSKLPVPRASPSPARRAPRRSGGPGDVGRPGRHAGRREAPVAGVGHGRDAGGGERLVTNGGAFVGLAEHEQAP